MENPFNQKVPSADQVLQFCQEVRCSQCILGISLSIRHILVFYEILCYNLVNASSQQVVLDNSASVSSSAETEG